LSQHKLLPNEIQFLKEAMDADYKDTNIRLREGEYQFALIKAIASFHVEVSFPDVKAISVRLYGEERTNDVQFIRKIQTILKKMEKSNIVRILPKKKPWELQRYALLSFKFRDSDKNLVNLVTGEQVGQMQNLLRPIQNQQEMIRLNYIRLSMLAFLVAASYGAVLWSLLQPTINAIIFIPALSVSALCSLLLGRALSKE
jgi:hypothetical protein